MGHTVLAKYVVLYLFLSFGYGKANETRIDMVDFLLGRMYKIGERLDDLEHRISSQSTQQPSNFQPAVMEDELVKGADVKTSIMLKAFGTEKKILRRKTEELFKKSNSNQIEIVELNKTLYQVVAKMNSMESVLNQQKSDVDGKVDDIESVIDNLKSEVEKSKEDNREAFRNFVSEIKNETAVVAENVVVLRKSIDHVTTEIENQHNRNEQQEQRISENSERIDELDKVQTATPFVVEKEKVMTCPVGWKKQLVSCILYVTDEELNWSDAARYCNRKGAVLAEPYTNEAFDQLRDGIPLQSDRRYYIGGSDRNSEGNWVWSSSGKTMDINKWGEGEPNNDNGNEDCLELIHTHFLNDMPCSIEQKFICEMKYEPVEGVPLWEN